ncbi:MAG: hypothetical protein QN193_11475 [Armatimonadota bacterium]|nr:hypothetical protein [Armatimonadota bacterium]MDR7445185.1 hypothetical protein [Armatimonadota bacterium]MDR7571216.1 hypothetical protein [Armatimonadota bacterium]MDR7613714.1 hypothetical protein [Armatimonadota bacterium]
MERVRCGGGFDERALVELTMAVITINAWNRLSIAFRIPRVCSAGPSRVPAF